MKSGEVALGLDVGGTKLAGILLDKDGHILAKRAIHSRASEGSARVIDLLSKLAETLITSSSASVVGIGLSTPGIVDSQHGLIRFVTTELPGWADAPVVKTLFERFNLPVLADNDGRAAALAEHRFGTGRGVDNFVTLVLGTGVGGGIIANGQMLHGSLGGAGRLGHLSVESEGPICSCGNRGCLELYLSGSAFARAAERAIAGGRPSSLMHHPNGAERPVSGRQVVQAAKQGDPLALEIVGQGALHLGQAIVQLARILDPERIAVGGSIAAADELLIKPAREYLEAHCPPQLGQTVEVVQAQFGRDASVVGAAILGWRIAKGKPIRRM